MAQTGQFSGDGPSAASHALVPAQRAERFELATREESRSDRPDRPNAPFASEPTFSLGQERERLARDLHDLAIGRLSVLGFELSSLSNLVRGAPHEKLVRAIQELDDTIRDLRQFVFATLDRSPGHAGLEPTIRTLLEEAQIRLGCTAQLSIHGDLDLLPPAVAHHLRAVVAEAVHNAVTHSRAANIAAQITISSNRVEVSVTDDGNGPPEAPSHGLGLGSMAARAHELNGTFRFTPGSTSGAVVRWSVPLPHHIGCD